MKPITYLLLLFIGIQTSFAQDGEVTVGNPICGTSITKTAPARYDYVLEKENSWVTMLYTSAQIGASGKIKALAFFVDCKVGSACNFQTAKNQKIYIKEVDYSELPSATEPDLSTYTLVYSGDITWRRGGTVENSKTQIILDSPFNYGGSKNLAIYFSNENDEPLGSPIGCGSSPAFLWNYSGANTVSYEFYKKGGKTKNGRLDTQLPMLRFYFGDINTDDHSPSAEKSLITANPTSIKANGVASSLITVQLYNKNGSILNHANQRVTLQTTAGKLSSVTDKKNGSYTAYLTSSTLKETATITGTLNGNPITDTEKVRFVKDGSGNPTDPTDPTSPSTPNNGLPKDLVQGFSPDGDGVNDYWEILPNVLSKYPNNELLIFNRQGNKVYEAAPYNNEWNGKSTGKITIGSDRKLPVGPYYFIFNTGENNQIFKGWVYLNY